MTATIWLAMITIGAAWLVSAGCASELPVRPATQPSTQPARELTLDLGNNVTMKLALIPSGKFMMGSPKDEAGYRDNDGPQHKVTISSGYYMGVYEVTRGQFARFIADTGYKTDGERDGWAWASEGSRWDKVDGASWTNPGFTQTDDHPAVGVSHNDAVAFCKWLGAKTGQAVRLPTEAQWEYACRAGTTTPFNTGPTISTDQANYNGNSVYGAGQAGRYRKSTVAVGSFKPNAFGLYDMHGNVWEWCADWCEMPYPEAESTDPRGPASGTMRVLRGGCWFIGPANCRSAFRVKNLPDYRAGHVGFRVVVDW